MRITQAMESLEKAGLSRYEAVVFVNLARAGMATAGELARASGVNRVQTYRALEGLEARGLVEVTLDRPRRYAARAINEVFDMVVEEKRAELETLDSIRKGLLDAWPKITARAPKAPSVRLQVIKGRAQIYKAIRRIVQEAQKEVLAFTTAKGIQRSYRAGVNELLVEAMARGVKARLIAQIERGNTALFKRVLEHVPLRHLGWLGGRFILVDRESILTFLIQDEATIRGDAETAMLTNSQDFVRAHVEFFEKAWAAGVDAEERLRSLGFD